MQGTPPVSPQDLKTKFVIYRRVVTGRNAFGQLLYGYTKRRGVKVAPRRQRSNSDVVQHNLTSSFSEYLWGNWWNWKDVAETDVLVRVQDRVQFGLVGKPVNHQGGNRWAIIEIVSNGDCLEGVDSCNCDTPEDEIPVPQGTSDVDQDLPVLEEP